MRLNEINMPDNSLFTLLKVVLISFVLISCSSATDDEDNGSTTPSLKGSDDFSNATILSGNNISFSASPSGATTEAGEPNESEPEGTIWYRWTAPQSGNAALWMAQSACCMHLSIFTGNTVANLQRVHFGSFTSHTDNFPIDAGETYYFQFAGVNNRDIYFFLNAAPPADDDFNDRHLITGANGTLNNQTLLNASFEATEPYHGPTSYSSGIRTHDGSIWFSWTALDTGLFDVTLDEIYYNSVPGADIHIYQGNTLGTLIHGSGAFGVEAGQTYQVQITGPSAVRILNDNGLASEEQPDYGPEFNILWTTVTDTPANDFFSQATVIAGISGTLANQTLTKASKEVGEPESSLASIWYEWTSGFTGQLRINAQGIDSNVTWANPVDISVYTGTDVASLTQVATNDTSNALTVNVVSGETYKIRIGSNNRCSLRAAGNYCTTEVSSTSPIGGIDNFDVSWTRIYGNDLSVQISGPRGNLLSDTITYTINATTTANTENVTIVSTIPSGLSVVSFPTECSLSGQIITCFYGSFTTNQAPLVWAFSAASPNSYNLTVDISQTGSEYSSDNNTQTVSTIVDTEIADLLVTIDAPYQVEIPATSQFDVTLSIENLGPSAAGNVVTDYTIPAGLSVSPGALPSGCTLTTSTNITCSTPTLNSATIRNFAISLDIDMNPVDAAIKTHEASVFSATTDAILENNTASERSIPVVDCEVVACTNVPHRQVPLPLWSQLLMMSVLAGIAGFIRRTKGRS